MWNYTVVSLDDNEEKQIYGYIDCGQRHTDPEEFPEGDSFPGFFSAFWIIMTLLAAPRIERLPAIVLPAASAIRPAALIPSFINIGR